MRTHLAVAATVLAPAILVTGCGGKDTARLEPEAGAISAHPAAAPAQRLTIRGEPADASPSTRGSEIGPSAPPSGRTAEKGANSRALSSAAADGFFLRLRSGQTLYSMARVYGVPLGTLMRVNGIVDARTIPDGKPIFIPGARKRLDVPQTYAAASLLPLAPLPGAVQPRGSSGARTPTPDLVWPIRGAVTSKFGRRGRRDYHEGIDIRGVRGEVIEAAAAGVVLRAGTGHGYGKMVVVDHGDGLTTLYAHASRLLVRAGDRVDAGQPIAEVGRTGNAKGPHLHFEVRRAGRPVDPRPLLDDQGGASSPPRTASPDFDLASDPAED